MNNYLERIMATKGECVAEAKRKVSLEEVKAMCRDVRPCFSLSENLRKRNGIIAEFKRQSPSKGVIHGGITPKQVVGFYEQAGVSAVSVLTDTQFFGGSIADLRETASVLNIPILRKEFINDPYQIYEARANGASAILLIAAVLERAQAQELAALANELGLEVLLELHDEEELAYITPETNVVGINNRNLRTFEVDLNHSISMASSLPKETPKVSESGIRSIDNMVMLRNGGFDGFLIGENFMAAENPGQACLSFCKEYTDRLSQGK